MNKFTHGQKINCYINNTYIANAKIYKTNNDYIFICHNYKQYNNFITPTIKGYEYNTTYPNKQWKIKFEKGLKEQTYKITNKGKEFNIK